MFLTGRGGRLKEYKTLIFFQHKLIKKKYDKDKSISLSPGGGTLTNKWVPNGAEKFVIKLTPEKWD